MHAPVLRLLLLLCTGLLAAAPGWAAAQGLGAARESAVKAAFLYKFASFVQWPESTFRTASEPFVFAVHGEEAVASELEQITRGRMVEGHPVTVQRIRDLDDAGRIHVLYAGGPRDSRVRELLAAVRGPVLTVTDAPAGGRGAAVLQFVTESGRVRFNASLTAAAARNLQLSARLLAVALQVEGR